MRRRFALGLLAIVFAGCQSVLGFKDFSGGSAGSGGAPAGSGGAAAGGAPDSGGAPGSGGASGSGGAGAGGASGSGGADAGGAPGSGGADAGGASGSGGACANASAPKGTVPVRLSTGKCIWMDAKEVTAGSYDSFANNLADPSPYTGSPCSWKTSFQRGCGFDAGSVDPNLPATCVDWCDARAYCLSKGEQLCGAAGDPSWWVAACTSGGAGYIYPYGTSYDSTACNDDTGCASAGCALVDVGTKTGCKTPSGIYDLSGNAAEWVNECTGTPDQYGTCLQRGGSVANVAADTQCDSYHEENRDSRYVFRGFRCCWAP